MHAAGHLASTNAAVGPDMFRAISTCNKLQISLFCGLYSVLGTPHTVELRAFMVSGQETTRLPVRSALFKQRTG